MNQSAIDLVLYERTRQDAKWGEQNHDPFTYLAVLTEEIGEFSQEALSSRFSGDTDKKGTSYQTDNLIVEAVQVAAVALAMVECLQRDKWRWA